VLIRDEYEEHCVQNYVKKEGFSFLSLPSLCRRRKFQESTSVVGFFFPFLKK
jgi:hypothetical protein